VTGLLFSVPDSSVRAQVILTVIAESAFAAAQQVLGFNPNSLPYLEPAHTFSESGNFACQFVALLPWNIVA
jgi:hypothetical protein